MASKDNTQLNRKHLEATRPRRWFSRLFWQILLVVGILLLVRTWTNWGTISGPAPVLEEVAINSEPVSLVPIDGRPLMIHFWASWCEICKAEEDTITELSRSINVVTIALNSGEKEEVARYMERRMISAWPTVVDNAGALAEKFGVKGVPATFILDGEGIIRFKEIGFTTLWGLKARLWLLENLFNS